MSSKPIRGFDWGRLVVSLIVLHLPALLFAAFFHQGHHFHHLLPVVPFTPFWLVASMGQQLPGCSMFDLGYAAVGAFHVISIVLLCRGDYRVWNGWLAAGGLFALMSLAALAGALHA